MKPIKVADSDAGWADKFEAEKKRLLSALATFQPEIDHVGSTSVPGLAAKPIIDISMAVPDRRIAEYTDETPGDPGGKDPVEPRGSPEHVRFVREVEKLGYLYRGDLLISGRLFFTRWEGDARAFNLHVTPEGHGDRRWQILFRDFLRAHPKVAEEYAAIKRAGASKHPTDMGAYITHKDPFIKKVMQDAETWIKRD